MLAFRPTLLMYGIGAAVALLILNRMMSGTIVSGAVATVAALPVDMVIGASDGLLGVPDTRTPEAQTACQLARESGDDWSASFQCPAATWFRGLFDGK